MYILAPISAYRPYKVKKLGQGGVGCVYEVRERDFEVAVKVPRKDSGEAGMILLARETAALSVVSHPNIVRFVSADTVIVDGEELPCLIEDTLDGISMGELLKDKVRFEPRRALEIIKKILQAVAAFHQEGFYNLDLKPSNIIFVLGEPILFDFASAIKNDDKSVFVSGTNGYWPPEALIYTILKNCLWAEYLACSEQALGEIGIKDDIKEVYLPHPRWDIHAVGIILFELLVGRSAIRSTLVDNQNKTKLRMFLRDLVEHLLLPGVINREGLHPEITKIILKATCFNPGLDDYGISERYQNSSEMIADIDQALIML